MNPLMNMLQGATGMNIPPQLQALVSMLKSGGNPQALLANMAQSNP